MIGLLIFVVLLALGYFVGRARDARHRAQLDEHEARLRAQLVVSQLTTPPPGADARLVMGDVVIATDYFKQLALGWRSLVGGEVKSYATLLERARREALVRCLDEAVRAGADHVVNVRFETSTIAAGGVEVLCFGTALRVGAVR